MGKVTELLPVSISPRNGKDENIFRFQFYIRITNSHTVYIGVAYIPVDKKTKTKTTNSDTLNAIKSVYINSQFPWEYYIQKLHISL